MKHKLQLYIFILLLIIPYTGNAGELSGYMSVEGRLFAKDPLYNEQRRDSASVLLQPEYYHDFSSSGFTFVPFFRFDSADTDRTHYDIRELNMVWYGDNWEFRAGIGKVFWGVIESQHLVDIINQTDLVESFNGEEKLGQPMLNLSLPLEYGTFDFFILPYFRERTFPGKKGRLRFSTEIDTDNAGYESNDEERHIDAAIRYSHTIGNWDVGISHFYGTGREPTIRPNPDKNGGLTLIPYYEQIDQTGLDVQFVMDEWLWKLESIYRSGQGTENFYALTAGFEYTFSGITAGGMDIGAIGEWLYDERRDNATTPYNNDIMGGLRFGLNDIASTEILIGMIVDYENSSQLFSLESNRRLSDHLKISIESYFLNPSSDDSLYDLRDDGYIEVELTYYY